MFFTCIKPRQQPAPPKRPKPYFMFSPPFSLSPSSGTGQEQQPTAAVSVQHQPSNLSSFISYSRHFHGHTGLAAAYGVPIGGGRWSSAAAAPLAGARVRSEPRAVPLSGPVVVPFCPNPILFTHDAGATAWWCLCAPRPRTARGKRRGLIGPLSIFLWGSV